MARMYPERFPRALVGDPRRAAEARVYSRLCADLDGTFTVMHGVCYLVESETGGQRDGEIDFLVGHPDLGLLVLEVKGGGIARDAMAGHWTSQDRTGAVHEIKDPIAQARGHKHGLLRLLKTRPGWARRWVPMAHGAVFPDSARPGRDLGPDAPLSILAFAEDMDALGRWTRGLFEHGGRGDSAGGESGHDDGKGSRRLSLGSEAFDELVTFLAPSYRLRMPLGAAIREDQRRIVELTEQQFRLLNQLGRMPRVVISGGAGTGKTLLALEQAQRLAAAGHRTLLTCFNRALAEFLRRSAGDRPNLTIWNFHQLCFRWARSAGLRALDPDGPLAKDQAQEYFERRLPHLLLKALGSIRQRFDALIVDEGQDFTDTYWRCLLRLLAEPDRARIHIFRDEAQDVFGSGAAGPEGMPEYHLTDNCRNTRSIHAVARALADDDTAAIGPEGRPPEFIEVREADEGARLAEVVARLVLDEGVLPEQIAVLTASRRSMGALAPFRRIGKCPVTEDTSGVPGYVLLETIHRFKGLERPVVVLAGLRDPARHVNAAKLLYVGVSRAQGHLVVLGDVAAMAMVRRRRGGGG